MFASAGKMPYVIADNLPCLTTKLFAPTVPRWQRSLTEDSGRNHGSQATQHAAL